MYLEKLNEENWKPGKKLTQEEIKRRGLLILGGISLGMTIWDLCRAIGVCDASIRNIMKLNKIPTPKGFRNTGKKPGRRKGFKHPEEWKENHRQRMLGDKNPFFGKKHTKETRDKMSLNHPDISGDKNPLRNAILRNPELREKLSQLRKDWWAARTPDQMRKFRENNSSREARGLQTGSGGFGRNHKSGTHLSSKASQFHYRSSWELHFAQILDNSEIIKRYIVEGISVPYFDGEITRHFRPDFRIYFQSGFKSLIEIKPENLVKTQLIKLNAQYEWSLNNQYQYELLTGDKLYDNDYIQSLLKNMDCGNYVSSAPIKFGFTSTKYSS